MRENGSDSTLPRPTRCSLILQFATHATTTHTMRAVDYVTHGFGSPTQVMSVPAYIPPTQNLVGGGGPIPPGFGDPRYTSTAPSSREILFRQIDAFEKAGLNPFSKAGIETLGTRGMAGLDQAIAYFKAADDAVTAIEKQRGIYYSLQGRVGTKDALDQVAQTIFATAASRVGLNPLIISMRDWFISKIRSNPTEAKKFWIAYSPSAAVQALQKVRASL